MIEALTCFESRWGAPGVGWRTTRTSAPIASMFLAVSMKVSPLVRLETLAEKSWTSAESRLAERLKLVRVLVEFSKKRLKTTLPWSAGTFLRLRRETSENDSAVSRMLRISSRERSSRPSRCLRFQAVGGGIGGSSASARGSKGPSRPRPGRPRRPGRPAGRGPGRSPTAWSRPSGRRRRPGSAARDGLGRPGRPGGPGAGRPRSQIEFRAARMVRPV